MLKVEPILQDYQVLTVAGLKFPQKSIHSDSLYNKPEEEQL